MFGAVLRFFTGQPAVAEEEPDEELWMEDEDGMDTGVALKIVVVGGREAGKSSVIRRYVQNCFTLGYLPTIGVDLFSCAAPRTVVAKGTPPPELPTRTRLYFFDVSHRELRGLNHSRIFEAADGVLLVFDISQTSSLEAVDQWRYRIAEHSPMTNETPVLLLANKMDLNAPVIKQADLLAYAQSCGYAGCGVVSCRRTDGSLEAAINPFLTKLIAAKARTKRVYDSPPAAKQKPVPVPQSLAIKQALATPPVPVAAATPVVPTTPAGSAPVAKASPPAMRTHSGSSGRAEISTLKLPTGKSPSASRTTSEIQSDASSVIDEGDSDHENSPPLPPAVAELLHLLTRFYAALAAELALYRDALPPAAAEQKDVAQLEAQRVREEQQLRAMLFVARSTEAGAAAASVGDKAQLAETGRVLSLGDVNFRRDGLAGGSVDSSQEQERRSLEFGERPVANTSVGNVEHIEEMDNSSDNALAREAEPTLAVFQATLSARMHTWKNLLLNLTMLPGLVLPRDAQNPAVRIDRLEALSSAFAYSLSGRVARASSGGQAAAGGAVDEGSKGKSPAPVEAGAAPAPVDASPARPPTARMGFGFRNAGRTPSPATKS